jgi:hypothetical protein
MVIQSNLKGGTENSRLSFQPLTNEVGVLYFAEIIDLNLLSKRGASAVTPWVEPLK